MAKEGECVVSPPGSPFGGPVLVEAVSLALQAAVLLACGSKTPHLAMLVHWVGDPVDARISANRLVEWIHQNDFIKFEHCVSSHPIRIQHPQVAATSACPFLSNRSQIAVEFQSLHTLIGGFSVHITVVDLSLPATTSYTHSVDNIALLGLVAESSGLVRT